MRAQWEAAGEDELARLLREEKEQHERREQAAVIGITFAAMCLEAFFFDYAAENLGESMAEHLDRLDLPFRLLIVPRLICGKGIDKSSHV